MVVNIHEAKTHFSRLLQKVAEGEEITIARAGVPIARLVAIVKESPARRPLGMLRGQIWIADDFDAPLPDDLQALFEGGPETVKIRPGRSQQRPAAKRRRSQ